MSWLWKKIQGYKTLGFNILVALGAVFAWAVTYDWTAITVDHAAGIVLFVNVVNIILRFVTSSPPLTGRDS
jgi:hypothetical protein